MVAVVVAVTVGETVGVDVLAMGDIGGVPAVTITAGLGTAVVVADGVGDGAGGATAQPATRTVISKATLPAVKRNGRIHIGSIQRPMNVAVDVNRPWKAGALRLKGSTRELFHRHSEILLAQGTPPVTAAQSSARTVTSTGTADG